MQRRAIKVNARESFAGKKAHALDPARIAELGRFIEQGEKETGVPGVALGLVQDGRVIFADGFGVKELGGTEKPNGDTLFMVASNTKAMTTLLLARLVDEHRFTWDTPVTSLFPAFKLGDADTTRSVLVKHLICACTGMPRQDMEWFFEYGKMTPENSLTLLGEVRRTLPVLQLDGRSRRIYRRPCPLPAGGSRSRLRSRHADIRLRSARDDGDYL